MSRSGRVWIVVGGATALVLGAGVASDAMRLPLAVVLGIGLVGSLLWKRTRVLLGEDRYLVFLAVPWSVYVFVSEAGLTGASGGSGVQAFSAVKLLPLGVVLGLGMLTLFFRASSRALESDVVALALFVLWLFVCSFPSDDVFFAVARVIQSAIPLVIVMRLRQMGRYGPQLFYMSIAACWAHAAIGVMSPTYVGVAGHQRNVGLLIANSFGYVCALTVITGMAVWLAKANGYRFALMLAGVTVGGLGVYQSVGRTAFIALGSSLLGVVLTWRFRRSGSTWAYWGIFGGLAGGFAWAMTHQASVMGWFSSTRLDAGSLSGRTTLWSLIWDQVAASPFFGRGPGALRSGGLNDQMDGLGKLGQAHNSAMEVLLAGGLPATLFWITGIMFVGVRCLRVEDPYRTPAVAVFGASLVFSLTTGGLGGFGMQWWIFLSLLVLPVRHESAELGAPSGGVEAQAPPSVQSVSV